MEFHIVLAERASVATTEVTGGAFERFLAGMQPHVRYQGRFPFEALGAIFAREIFRLTVHHLHVPIVGAFVREAPPARIAVVLRLATVNGFVIHQHDAFVKPAPTVRTAVPGLSCPVRVMRVLVQLCLGGKLSIALRALVQLKGNARMCRF